MCDRGISSSQPLSFKVASWHCLAISPDSFHPPHIWFCGLHRSHERGPQSLCMWLSAILGNRVLRLSGEYQGQHASLDAWLPPDMLYCADLQRNCVALMVMKAGSHVRGSASGSYIRLLKNSALRPCMIRLKRQSALRNSADLTLRDGNQGDRCDLWSASERRHV